MTTLNTYKIRWDSGPTIVNFNFCDMVFLSMCTCIGKYCFVFGYFLYQFNYMAFGLLIGCLNVRGIGDKQKRREMFNWLRAKNFSIYCYKRCIVLKILQQFGRLNGVTRLCLAVAPAPRVVLPFLLTTILPFKFSGLIWTQLADLLFAISN